MDERIVGNGVVGGVENGAVCADEPAADPPAVGAGDGTGAAGEGAPGTGVPGSAGIDVPGALVAGTVVAGVVVCGDEVAAGTDVLETAPRAGAGELWRKRASKWSMRPVNSSGKRLLNLICISLSRSRRISLFVSCDEKVASAANDHVEVLNPKESFSVQIFRTTAKDDRLTRLLSINIYLVSEENVGFSNVINNEQGLIAPRQLRSSPVIS